MVSRRCLLLCPALPCLRASLLVGRWACLCIVPVGWRCVLLVCVRFVRLVSCDGSFFCLCPGHPVHVEFRVSSWTLRAARGMSLDVTPSMWSLGCLVGRYALPEGCRWTSPCALEWSPSAAGSLAAAVVTSPQVLKEGRCQVRRRVPIEFLSSALKTACLLQPDACLAVLVPACLPPGLPPFSSPGLP